MHKELLTIGEMASLCGLTAKALRLYERKGLIAPRSIDSVTRYRYYSTSQLVRMDVIKAARSMGMSLGEIRAALERADGKSLIAFLDEKRKLAAERMGELRRAMASMDAAKTAIAGSLSSSREAGVFVKELPERVVLSRKLEQGPNGLGLREAAIAYVALEREAKTRKLVDLYEGGILLIPTEAGDHRPSELFLSVGIDADSEKRGLRTIPAGMFYCVRYGEATAASQQAKLGSFLSRRRLRPAVMLQVELLGDLIAADESVAELQVLAVGRREANAESPTQPRRSRT